MTTTPRGFAVRTWIALTMVSLLALSALVVPPAAQAEELYGGQYGGDYRIAVGHAIGDDFLDPIANDDLTEWRILDLVYDRLARTEADTFEVIPWLAEGWVQESEMEFRVTIHPDARWHDGTAISATDVVASYDLSWSRNAIYGAWATGVTISAEDDGTVLFTLPAPSATFFSQVLQVPLVKSSGNAWVGSGPYVPAEQAMGNATLTLEAFQGFAHGRPFLDTLNYYPYPSGTVDEKTAAASVALLGEELDMIGWTVTSTDLTKKYEFNVTDDEGNSTIEKRQLADVKIERANDLSYLYFGFNTSTPPLDQAGFRNALALAIDKDTFPAQHFINYANVADSTVLPDIRFWYNASVQNTFMEDEDGEGKVNPIDLAKSNNLLDELGITDLDGDGYRDIINEDGTFSPLRLTFLSPPNNQSLPEVEWQVAASVEHAIRNLDQVGICIWDGTDCGQKTDTKADGEPWLVDDIGAGVAAGEPFDIFVAFQVIDLQPDYLADLFGSNGADNIVHYTTYRTRTDNLTGLDEQNRTLTLSAGFVDLDSVEIEKNASGIFDLVGSGGPYAAVSGSTDAVVELRIADGEDITPEDFYRVTYRYEIIDDLVARSGAELDPAVRQSLIREIQGVVSEDVPVMPLIYRMAIEVHENRIFTEGWNRAPGGVNNYWSFYEVHQAVEDRLIVTLSLGNSFDATATATAKVIVTTSGGDPVAGAEVALSIFGGSLEATNGTTDDLGEFRTTFVVADFAEVTDGVLEVEVAAPALSSASTSTSFTVHPTSPTLDLALVISTVQADSMDLIALWINVTSEGAPVDETTLRYSISPAGAGGSFIAVPSDSGGGAYTATFQAAVTGKMGFTLEFWAEAPGFEGAEAKRNILIEPVALDLSVSIGSDRMASGGERIEVKVSAFREVTTTSGSDRVPVEGANLTINLLEKTPDVHLFEHSADATGLGMDFLVATTGADGTFTFWFGGVVEETTPFHLEIDASMEGFGPDDSTKTLQIYIPAKGFLPSPVLTLTMGILVLLGTVILLGIFRQR